MVAFHSLEDRIVKNFLIERSGKSANPSRHMPDPQNSRKASFRMLTKKTVTPGEAPTGICSQAVIDVVVEATAVEVEGIQQNANSGLGGSGSSSGAALAFTG